MITWLQVRICCCYVLAIISYGCYQSNKKVNHSPALFEERSLCVFKVTGLHIMTPTYDHTYLLSRNDEGLLELSYSILELNDYSMSIVSL